MQGFYVMKYGHYTVSRHYRVLTVMRTKRQKPEGRFRELLKDIKEADSRILRLFPSLDFGRNLSFQVKRGLETDLRVLLVAAERGYVNHNVLKDEYVVGGDSRKRSLHKLEGLALLSRSEELSEKRVRKDVYRLSGKGLLLCAAFPRIFKSELYVSLITNCASKSLANTMLILYDEATSMGGNRLLDVLHWAADRGLNLENIPEEALAERLLSTEELTEKGLLGILLSAFLDVLPKMTNDDVEAMLHDVSAVVRTVHSEPVASKLILTFQEESYRLLRSSDFLVWLKARRALGDPIRRFLEIFRESYPKDLRYIESHDEAFWNDTIRNQIFPQVRRRLHEEALSMTGKLETGTLEGGG